MTACKGLFMRVRHTSKTLSMEVISRIYGIEKSHATVPVLNSKITKWFCEWRHCLKRALTNLADSRKAL